MFKLKLIVLVIINIKDGSAFLINILFALERFGSTNLVIKISSHLLVK